MCTNVSIAKRLNCSIHDLPKLDDENPIWDVVAYYLANVCLSLLYLLSIEKIVIGGGVMNRKILYAKINKKVKEMVNQYVNVPDNYVIEPAINDVGLIGALIL